jgi:arylsulfatase A-like enzyme
MIAPDYNLEEVDLVFLEKSQAFIENHVKTNPDRPFFLYHATQAVHLPSFPADRLKGQTKAGPHGDFIFELDFIVGELLKTLEELGVAENTLVIFSSDNGPEVITTYHMRTDHGHDPARPWRGMKRDQWEGGHRVPFIVRWPDRIDAGQITDQMTSLTDVMATIAAIVGADLPEKAAEDSYNMLPVFLGEQGEEPVRKYLIQQSSRAQCLSIRRGSWKYLDHKDSGGNRYERNEMLKEYILPETAPDAPGQLYNLATDSGEKVNLYYEKPEVVAELKQQLEKFKTSGRSAPHAIDYGMSKGTVIIG